MNFHSKYIFNMYVCTCTFTEHTFMSDTERPLNNAGVCKSQEDSQHWKSAYVGVYVYITMQVKAKVKD